jgi:hypothetical protein
MLAALIAVLVIAAVVAFTVTAYRREWRWTGLPADPGDGSEAHPPRAAKTLWDWLQLLVVPLVLALGAFALNAAQSDRDRRQEDRRAAQQRMLEERRAASERASAEDRVREDTLRAYIQQMSDLITRHGVVEAPRYGRGAETNALARTLTLVALRRLDGRRKGLVVQFLTEAKLITQNVPWRQTRRGLRPDFFLSTQPKVSLVGADLRGAVMPPNLGVVETLVVSRRARNEAATFDGANLQGADFRGRKLVSVSFMGANLRHARFDGATLSGTPFARSCLSGATFVDAKDAFDVGPDFRGAVGSGIDFSNAALTNAIFVNSVLTKVKLTGASTSGVPRPRAGSRMRHAFAREVCGAER